jgi:mono/diheme cytochrome c family protein
MHKTDLGTSWKRILALLILSSYALFVSACAPESDRPLGERQSAERGETVFDYNCGFCHGVEGRGPGLAEIKSLSKADRRKSIINHPISGQIPQRLSAHELADLVEYLESDERSVDQ